MRIPKYNSIRGSLNWRNAIFFPYKVKYDDIDLFIHSNKIDNQA